jgi:hypothetical protein
MQQDNQRIKDNGAKINFKDMAHYIMNIHNHYRNHLIIEILIMLKSKYNIQFLVIG